MNTMKNMLSLLAALAAASLLAAEAHAQINIHIAGAVSLKDVTYNTRKTWITRPNPPRPTITLSREPCLTCSDPRLSQCM